jgi:hypothetical protein
MAATAILLATASVIIIVFRRIHIAKHHEIKVSVVPKTPWDIIIAVVVLVFGLPTIFSLISTLSSYNSSYTSTGDYVSTNQAEDLEKQKQDKQEFGTDCSNLGGSFAQNLIPYRSRSVVSKITPTTTTTSPSTDISLKDEGGGEVHAVVNSSQIKLFDIDCNIIDPSTLREGDAVVYYMDSSNSSFAALQIVAKNTN